MIEIYQALTADFVAQAFGLPIAHENASYTPTPGTPWVRLRVFRGDTSAGDVAAATKEEAGFFQFTLHYPEGNGAITAHQQAQTIFDAYPLARRVSYGGETVRVTRWQLFDAKPDNGWFQVVGRIFYELE